MNKINIKLWILISLFTLVVNFNVGAFGVTAFYTDDIPLVMNPGETKDVYLELQNMVGNEDITMKAELTGDSEIARVTDKSLDYFVPLGKKDVKVNLRITIPSGDPIGKEYSISRKFKQMGGGGAGMVQFGGEVAKAFPVVVGKVVKKEKVSGYSVKDLAKQGYLVAGLLILIIIGYVLVRNIKKRQQNNI